MLFDPFEKQFNVPTSLIKISHALRWQCKMIGQEDQGFLAQLIPHSHPAQGCTIGAAGFGVSQTNSLIATQALILGDGARAHHAITQEAPAAHDKKSLLLGE